MFTSRMQFKCFLLLFTCFITFTYGLDTKPYDLCSGDKGIDLSALNFRSPWRVFRNLTNSSHLIDILPCQNFSSQSLKIGNIPDACKGKAICHTITSNSQVKYIGYVPSEVTQQFNTHLAHFVGPACGDKVQMGNYTVDIRFVCGNNLGYPSFARTVWNNCKTILYWETAAACKGSSSGSSFGINESPCYVIDQKGRRYDLSPLIRPKGSYKVWSSDQKDFFINVCTDASDKCGPDSSACARNGNGQMESVGSYKWASIEFGKSSEAVKHDYIDLTYKLKNSKCNSPGSNLNESTTNIRFICPKHMPSSHRYPVLISSLDCRHDIEWVTDYACPQETVSFPQNDCKVEDVNFNQLQSDKGFEFNDIHKPDGTNVSISLNVCGSISKNVIGCPNDSSVCIAKNGKISSFSKKNAIFKKADNLLSLIYNSASVTCNNSGDFQYERTIVEFECDPNASPGQPEFVEIDECLYLFKWRTNVVCPLLAPTLNCTFVNDDLGFEVDLSALTLRDASYQVQRYMHDPKYYYMLSPKKKILLNICGALPAVNNTAECANSAACLVDNVDNKNVSISLGHFRQPLTFNKELKALQLRYTGGYDPETKRELSTLINFHCESWSQDSEPHLVDYDQASGLYTIEFNTPAACPLQTIQGDDCTVTDPLTKFVYNLKPLASKSFYSVKSDNYDFQLNVCGPIKNGACGDGVAICQKEKSGEGRAFSLGRSSLSLSYWNTILNMTFVGGTPYNDPNRTPRKSHISFLCDPNAQNGFPEFYGEKDRAYFFRWYTSLACPSPVPKVTHCVYENQTHFFDLSPLSLVRGNHFEIGKSGSIVYINFCRPLNKIRENLLGNCKANSGICLIEDFHQNKHVSLGEPAGHPFMGFDGNIYLLYNNGDPCIHNRSLPITSRVQLVCDPTLDEDLVVTFIDPNEELIRDGTSCTYEFIVRTPLACPRAFNDVNLDKCIYTDKRTNLSADLNQLTKSGFDYSIPGANGPQSTFSLNVCKPVKPLSPLECKDSAVCFRYANNSVVSYGSVNEAKLYTEGNNLHLRYTNGSVCDTQLDKRTRSTDIEFICDPSAHSSVPTLYFQNHCLAKFQWHTSAVCNLVVPACSYVDESTGDYYSLRPLASMSHVWNVTTSKPNEFYLINVCKPLPVNHNCSSSAAACKCHANDGALNCDANIGKVSDHELTFDQKSQDLILVYEDGDKLCDGVAAQTQIRFRCSKQSGYSGPQLMSVDHCTHHFVWDTIFACSRRNIQSNSVQLSLSDDFIVHDARNDFKWDFSELFSTSFNVSESGRDEKYLYLFNFQQKHVKVDGCYTSAICQTKPTESTFTRDLGSLNNWHFSLIGSDLYMELHSNHSSCGRNKNKNVTSKIRFECSSSVGLGRPQFLYESQECEYVFFWETSVVCQLMADRAIAFNDSSSHTKTSGSMSPTWIVFSISLFALFAFAGWLFVSSSSARDDVVYHIRRMFRRNEAPQIPFRYQQLSL